MHTKCLAWCLVCSRCPVDPILLETDAKILPLGAEVQGVLRGNPAGGGGDGKGGAGLQQRAQPAPGEVPG